MDVQTYLFYMITQEKLKELYEYKDGNFIRKINVDPTGRGKGQIGTLVKGSAHDERGYLKTTVLGKKYYIHRFVWLYHYGYSPKYIDHINNDPSDNRLENLREATFEENKQNTNRSVVNTSGIKGLYYSYKTNRWCAEITAFGKRHRKSFSGPITANKEKAIQWLQAKRAEVHGEFTNHG
jgi:hypothetical protein